MISKKITRRDFAGWIGRGSLGFVALAAGCGGSGGGSSSSASRSTPTAATKSRVLKMHDLSVRGVTQSGFQNQNVAYARNGAYGGGGVYSGGTAVGAPPLPSPASSANDSSGHTMPLVGAFLRNVAATPPKSRAFPLRSISRGEGGGTGVALPPEPPVVDPVPPLQPPTFYFDYYLGLWVEITETNASNSVYLLYEDEAKTKAAGSITTTNPTDWEIFPQVYASRYEFTAGFLAGSHGSSENVTNADYSGRSSYENTYADGWKDKGKSSWSGRGDFTWTSRTDGANSEWNEAAGSFRADGSGGTRLSTSDGYAAVYVYSADGSGHGRITGSDPGLPVSVSWDAYGNTTITYADGSTEYIAGWGSYYGGGDNGGGGPIPVDLPPVAETENSDNKK